MNMIHRRSSDAEGGARAVRSLAVLAGLLALFVSLTASAQVEIASQVFDDGNGTRAEVRSVFDPLPPSGYAPLRVVVTNGSERDTNWSFHFESNESFYRNSNRHASGFHLEVPARRTDAALFLAPLAVSYGQQTAFGYANHHLQCRISSSDHGERMRSHHAQRVQDFPAIAISKALADASITRLNDEVKWRRSSSSGGSRGGGYDVFGSRFDSADLPEDWLGFSGFDYVLLAASEWQALKPGARTALIQWARLGGQVHVYLAPGDSRSLNLPGQSGASSDQPMSLGKVQTYEWDGRNLKASETVTRYWGEAQRVKELVKGYTDKSPGLSRMAAWGLLNDLGIRSFASWQVILFLVVFGILVGPVNLFVLAPSGRRHRLFFTTPALSLGASALMIALILFQDGTGGTGRRLIVVNVEPQETAAYVTQEQVSRTGVLLSAGFEMSQPALVEPLALPDTEWVKLKNAAQSQGTSLSQQGRIRGGNFFQSRTEQAQIVRAVISTRARVELKRGREAATAPAVVSALGLTVKELFFVDDAGKAWKTSGPLATGQEAELQECKPGELGAWWTAARKSLGEKLGQRLGRAVDAPRGMFFATADAAPGFAIDTLKSIRWKDDGVLVFGTVAKP